MCLDATSCDGNVEGQKEKEENWTKIVLIRQLGERVDLPMSSICCSEFSNVSAGLSYAVSAWILLAFAMSLILLNTEARLAAI